MVFSNPAHDLDLALDRYAGGNRKIMIRIRIMSRRVEAALDPYRNALSEEGYKPIGWRASKPNGMRGAACQRGAQIRERLWSEVVSRRSPAMTAKA